MATFSSRFLVIHPWASLTISFLLWKSFLLCVAFLSPGEGYDTSTFVAFRAGEVHPNLSASLLGKLSRWDAIYYTTSARRGYLFEQEWAFGWGLTRLFGWVARSLPLPWPDHVSVIFSGVLVAHVSHLASVIMLFQLYLLLVASKSKGVDLEQRAAAFAVAALHIITPAGLFLSAPYGESLFSFLNFLGLWLYAQATSIAWHAGRPAAPPLLSDVLLISSGLAFGCATTVRSNGLICGVLFAWDLLERVLVHFRSEHWSSPAAICRTVLSRRVMTLMLAGVVTALGSAVPQWIAYQQYCEPGESGQEIPPWCLRTVPSIYAYVQSHYWGNGFLTYWTLSNLPLFLLAAPTLLILTHSSLEAIVWKPADATTRSTSQHDPTLAGTNDASVQTASLEQFLRRRLAVPQLIIAILALTTLHVQIVTRIASGYPIWYMVIAERTFGRNRTGADASGRLAKHKSNAARAVRHKATGRSERWDSQLSSFLAKDSLRMRSGWVIQWMVLYATIQGGLYASFLPPA